MSRSSAYGGDWTGYGGPDNTPGMMQGGRWRTASNPSGGGVNPDYDAQGNPAFYDDSGSQLSMPSGGDDPTGGGGFGSLYSSPPGAGHMPGRVGSPNLSGFAGLSNFMQNTGGAGGAGAAYMRRLGITPSYNGSPIDQSSPSRYESYASGVGNSGPPTSGFGVVGGVGDPTMRPGPNGSWLYSGDGNSWTDARNITGTPGFGAAAGAAGSGGGAGVNWANALSGGGGGAGGSAAGGLDGQVAGAYSGLLARGGSPYDAGQQARMVQNAGDDVNRATGDSIQQARLDAIRRGDTSLSSTPDLEARIRAQGAMGAEQARFGTQTGLAGQAQGGLLAGLGGASGYLHNQQALQLLQGQLASQGGLSGVGLMLGGYGGNGQGAGSLSGGY